MHRNAQFSHLAVRSWPHWNFEKINEENSPFPPHFERNKHFQWAPVHLLYVIWYIVNFYVILLTARNANYLNAAVCHIIIKLASYVFSDPGIYICIHIGIYILHYIFQFNRINWCQWWAILHLLHHHWMCALRGRFINDGVLSPPYSLVVCLAQQCQFLANNIEKA